MTEIYFHEDDYCQIEVLPISNWEHCAAQIGEIESFSKVRRAPGGIGWTDMYVREENSSSLHDLGISRTTFASALCEALPECDAVYTGYSTHREKCEQTAAFGNSTEVAVFADFGKDDVVEHIWLALDVTEQDEVELMLKAFHALGTLSDLLLVDWGWGVLSPLNDGDALKRYMLKRIEVFSEIRASFAPSNPKPKWWQFWKRR